MAGTATDIDLSLAENVSSVAAPLACALDRQCRSQCLNTRGSYRDQSGHREGTRSAARFRGSRREPGTGDDKALVRHDGAGARRPHQTPVPLHANASGRRSFDLHRRRGRRPADPFPIRRANAGCHPAHEWQPRGRIYHTGRRAILGLRGTGPERAAPSYWRFSATTSPQTAEDISEAATSAIIVRRRSWSDLTATVESGVGEDAVLGIKTSFVSAGGRPS